MTLRSSFWVLIAVVAGCGGTSNVDLGDGGGDDAAPQDSAPGPDANSGDGGIPADATADSSTDSGAFSPLNLPGLALWLDAEHKTAIDANSKLQTWGDLSGNANDATQSNPAGRPTVTAKAINNLPAVHFEGVGSGPFLVIADAPTLEWGTGDFLIALVARYSNNPTFGLTTGAGNFYWKSTFTGNAGAGVGFLANIPTAQYTVVNGLALSLDGPDYVFTQTTYNDGQGRIYATRRAGTKLELRVNASSVATQTPPNQVDVSATGTAALVGAIATGTYYRLAGDIAEMIAVKGPISDGNLTSLELYLKTKYGL